jgi:sugar phosphate isomerase/epimerase
MFTPRHISCDHATVAANLPAISELGLGVEIMFESTEDLWPQVRWENLLDLADAVQDAGVESVVHGPFHGLNLGTLDFHIRSYSLEVLMTALEAARAFRAPLMVFHTGFVPQYSPKSRAKWLDAFSIQLEHLLARAADLQVRLAMENTYETDLTLFEEIFERFPGGALGMCLDVAHAHCFGQVNPAEWSRRFADRIVHLHLSDNDGHFDLHQALGSGSADFRSMLDPLARLGGNASVTFEVAGEDAAASRDYFDTLARTLTEQARS